MTPKAQSIKDNSGQLNFAKIKMFVGQKTTSYRLGGKLQIKSAKIKALLYRKHRQLSNPYNKKASYPIRKLVKDWNRHSTKKRYMDGKKIYS